MQFSYSCAALSLTHNLFVMAAQLLYFAAVVSVFYLCCSSVFLAYSQRSQIGCLLYFLSANLECRSEMYCTWLAENTGCKNDAKIRHLRTIAQLCRSTSSQLRHVKTC